MPKRSKEALTESLGKAKEKLKAATKEGNLGDIRAARKHVKRLARKRSKVRVPEAATASGSEASS